jgi:hypothetical protein
MAPHHRRNLYKQRPLASGQNKDTASTNEPDPEESPVLRSLAAPVPAAASYEWTETASRCFQRLIQTNTNKDNQLLLLCLENQVDKTACSMHGNHVLREAFTTCSAQATTLLAFKLQRDYQQLLQLCKNRYACRVVNAMLQHQPDSVVRRLQEVLIAKFEDLSGDRFGNFVVKEAIEHTQCPCFMEHAHRATDGLLAALVSARAPLVYPGWDVVAAAMTFGPIQWRLELATPVLCASPDSWLQYIVDKHTNLSLACRRLRAVISEQ